MRRFFCDCGQEIFLENRHCTQCNNSLGYEPFSGQLLTLSNRGKNWHIARSGFIVKPCHNGIQHGVCNALIDVNDPNELCLTCRLNRTIPDLSKEGNLRRWGKLEEAKRRLVYGLLKFGLPLNAPVAGFPRGLCFDFLQDKRTDPDATLEYVSTGHFNGVITINVLEADEVQRVWQKEQSHERYRTLLGHLRHEAGHYYYELLVTETTSFQRLFGDPGIPYADALKRFYEQGPLDGWEQNHISAYASAHPLEDWAECFAHYLHMTDTIETASSRGAIAPLNGNECFEDLLNIWDGLAVTLNELNRSLGLADAYPFVITPGIADKLHFINDSIITLGQNFSQPA